MGVTLSKHKLTVPVTEKKSLAVQTDMEQSEFSTIILNDPRSPSIDFQRTPIQVQVLNEEVENMQLNKIGSVRNKHLEKVKNLSKLDSPLNIKMKFVEHATIVYDQIERINNRKLLPKSRKFVTVIESKSANSEMITNQKPYLETNLDELEPISVPVIKSKDDDKINHVTAEFEDPVQKAIDQMTENLNDLKMLTLNRQKKPVMKSGRQTQAKEIEVITIDDTPKKSIHQEKVRTPFVEIQSRIPVSKNRKATDMVKKKLNVDLDENIENSENVLVVTESKLSNITFMEPKPAHWDKNNTLLF